jgi:tetraacyldisaccharide 4'-kinase
LAASLVRSHPGLWRRQWFRAPGRQQRLRRPVISVGNLAAGGRGKTPVVEHVARVLVDAGERPAILSRGYGRRESHPGAVVVSDGRAILAGVREAGDEPLMLAHALPGVPVVVCDDRRIAGALAETALGATVHVLDDGFQHLALARDVDLVVVAARDLTSRAFPFGPLREPAAALEAADAILSADGARPGGQAGSRAARFEIRRSLESVTARGTAWSGQQGPVVALAAIAEPARFVRDLTGAGWLVAGQAVFPDHRVFTARDLARVRAIVGRTGARGVITTAKDAVRLPADPDLGAPLAVARLRVAVEPAAPFRAWLADRLAEARR